MPKLTPTVKLSVASLPPSNCAPNIHWHFQPAATYRMREQMNNKPQLQLKTLTEHKQLKKAWTEIELIIEQFSVQFKKDFTSANAIQLSVENEKEYQKIIEFFPSAGITEERTFPRSFKFSKFAISLIAKVKKFRDECSKVVVKFKLGKLAKIFVLRRADELIFGQWEEDVKSFSSGVDELLLLLQLAVDFDYVQVACEHPVDSCSRNGSLVECQRVFGGIHDVLICQIDKIVQDNVKKIMTSTDYNWAMIVVKNQESELCSSFIKYLQETCGLLTSSPFKLAEYILKKICEQFVLGVMTLLDDNVKTESISSASFEQLLLDFKTIQNVSAKCEIARNQLKDLPIIFEKITQLLNLIVSCKEHKPISQSILVLQTHKLDVHIAKICLEKLLKFEDQNTRLLRSRKRYLRNTIDQITSLNMQ